MNEISEITVQDVHALGGAVVIDVREVSEFEEGHAAGAVNIPMSELGARIDELPQDGEQFFLICHGGGRSGRATEALRSREYNAVNILGGTVGWADAGFAIER